MSRFSIKDLLVATALIAAGLGGLAYLAGYEDWSSWQLALWLATGPVIGCGLLFPFRRPWLGLALGVVMQSLVFLVSR